MKQAYPVWCTRGFDCSEGEHRLLKQTCHFDYEDKFLCQTNQSSMLAAVVIGGTWGIKKNQLQTGILKSKLTQ